MDAETVCQNVQKSLELTMQLLPCDDSTAQIFHESIRMTLANAGLSDSCSDMSITVCGKLMQFKANSGIYK